MRVFHLPLLFAALALLAGHAYSAPAVKAPVKSIAAGDPLTAGDAAYVKKSYAVALPLYRSALKKKLVSATRRPQIEYRIAKALGRTSQWDPAIQQALQVCAGYAGTAWEARSRALLMELYLASPHEVWKLGDKLYRQQEMPLAQGDELPERVDVTEEDYQRAVRSGEQGKRVFEKLRKELSGSEEADLDADLARVVGGRALSQWAERKKWRDPEDEYWTPEPGAKYDLRWEPPKKVLQLLLDAEAHGTTEQKPLARLAQALWLRGYHNAMFNAAVDKLPDGTLKHLPYPYQKRSELDVLRSLAKDYPKSAEGEHARVLVGDWLQGEGRYPEALATYRAFVKQNPESKWAADAKVAIEQITRLALTVDPPELQAPGKKAQIYVSTANVEKVKLTAHRVRLEEMVKDPRALAADQGFDEVLKRIGGWKGVAKFYKGEPLSWTVAANGEPAEPKRDPYAPRTTLVTTPLMRAGAYLIEGEAGPVRSAALLIITDLAIIQVSDAERGTVMAVNAQTGAPVFEANVLLRETQPPVKEKPRFKTLSGTTNAEGLFHKPLDAKNDSRTLAFAWKGERYAFTGETYRNAPEKAELHRAFVYTERPVYRTGQRVYYRALLASRPNSDSAWDPDREVKAKVKITNPAGALLETQEVTSNEFGSIHGQVELSGGASLGTYQIQVLWGDEKHPATAEDSFGVEEYKKPEFEVTVKPTDPSAGPVRLGEPLTAKIAARYYFGSPVAKAKVKYTVTRSEWSPQSPLDSPYIRRNPWSGLNASPLDLEDQTPDPEQWIALNPEVVLQGVATTNDKGEVELKIPTVLKDPRYKGRHLEFAIEAEVTDASRRTIQGSGTVRALATQFNAFLKMRQGFYSPGDRLQADLRTLDAEGRPIAVSGTVHILRRTYADHKPKLTEVFSEPIATDASGRATPVWRVDEPGSYVVRWEARDAWEQPVVAKAEAWVAGEAAGDGVFHHRHLTLQAERPDYRIGQNAKLLLVADEPGLTVLLSRVAGDRVLDQDVVRIVGRSQVLDLPLTRADAPDVTFVALGVRDRELFRADATVHLSPADSLLNVALTADKATYKPGEKAVFHLRARDVDGRPVRTECSVGVVDASTFYIAGSEGASIAGFVSDEERGANLQPQESLTARVDGLTADEQPALKGERRAWTFPAGLGTLSLEVRKSRSRRVNGDSGLQAAGQFIADDIYSTRWPSRRNAFAENEELLYVSDAAHLTASASAPGGAVTKAAKAPAALPSPKGDEGRLTARITTRSNFADTAFWTPAVVTNSDGEATVEMRWPDNLTQWRATTIGWTDQAQVGEASTDVTTAKDLLVRLQSPRFFVERDEVVLSANVHNYTSKDKRIRVELDLGGETLYPASSSPFGPPQPKRLIVPRADRPADPNAPIFAPETTKEPVLERTVDVPKGGETRVDWKLRVERPGEARVRVVADGGDDSDAMEMRFPVLVHGIEKLQVKSGSLLMEAGEKSGSRTAKLTLNLPVERAPGSGDLVVQVSPSAASAMLDALPYLVDYPYGCVEQTMDRFLPSVVSAKTLTDLGIDLHDLQRKAQAEDARRKSQRPKDRLANSAYTYETDQWQWRAEKSPVFNPQVMQKMVGQGLARLQRFQHADGGWGWWEHDTSDERMTAFVLQGLVTGRASGVQVPQKMLDRGFAWLATRFAKTTHVQDLAYQGWVLSMEPKRGAAIAAVLMEKVYPQRERLTPYGLALLALALHKGGKGVEAHVCMQNLLNGAKIDKEAGTCYWPSQGKYWWEWYHDDTEAAAACLRVYNTLDPKSQLAPMVVRWLMNRRTGSAWTTTRETAMAIQALAEYVKLHKELQPDCTVTVEVDGKQKRTFKLTAEDALLADNRFVIPAKALTSGAKTITITRTGHGNVYYTAALRYFTLEEGIQAAGNEIHVRRRYFRLTRPEGAPPADAPHTQDGYLRALVKPGEHLTSGDLLEVELVLESKNDYDYLVFEDMKPAGCEPVELRSGGSYQGGLCSNVELRDQKVAFFLTTLPQGRHLITYRLRAEVPGAFHALPVNGYAMYAPLVRCISDEGHLTIGDAQVEQARQ